MHKNSLVCGVASRLWSKGALVYRCLNKMFYTRLAACSSIHNSSGQHSCPTLQLHANENPPSHRQKGQKSFRSLRNLKTDLDLTVEGDLSIVMAFAEKLRGGLHSFVFGKPFYTSVQERDALLSFWLRVPALWTMYGRRTWATSCIVPVSPECCDRWFKCSFLRLKALKGSTLFWLYSFISFKGCWTASLKRYSVLNIRGFIHYVIWHQTHLTFEPSTICSWNLKEDFL